MGADLRSRYGSKTPVRKYGSWQQEYNLRLRTSCPIGFERMATVTSYGAIREHLLFVVHTVGEPGGRELLREEAGSQTKPSIDFLFRTVGDRIATVRLQRGRLFLRPWPHARLSALDVDDTSIMNSESDSCAGLKSSASASVCVGCGSKAPSMRRLKQ